MHIHYNNAQAALGRHIFACTKDKYECTQKTHSEAQSHLNTYWNGKKICIYFTLACKGAHTIALSMLARGQVCTQTHTHAYQTPKAFIKQFSTWSDSPPPALTTSNVPDVILYSLCLT